jgi:hypothetical protein
MWASTRPATHALLRAVARPRPLSFRMSPPWLFGTLRLCGSRPKRWWASGSTSKASGLANASRTKRYAPLSAVPPAVPRFHTPAPLRACGPVGSAKRCVLFFFLALVRLRASDRRCAVAGDELAAVRQPSHGQALQQRGHLQFRPSAGSVRAATATARAPPPPEALALER